MVWLFGKKIRNILSGSHILFTTSNFVNSHRCRMRMAKTCTKMQNTLAGNAEPCFCSLSPNVYLGKKKVEECIVTSLLCISGPK